MKRYLQYSSRRTVQILLAVVGLACIGGFVRGRIVSPTPGETGKGNPDNDRPPCCRREITASPPTDRSLYQLESQWTSDVGRTIPLRILQGRPQVLALHFTHCEFACPITLHDLKRIQDALPEEVRSEVDFVLVTLDPDRDQPAVLARYRQEKKLGADHWTLLTGSADDIRELAALLGVNYRKDERGQFAHSNVITILDRNGEVVHQQVGLNADPGESINALRQCVDAKSGAQSSL